MIKVIGNRGFQMNNTRIIDYHVLNNVVYIGNDINDLEVMLNVGYPVCPADAYEEIRKVSKLILNVSGGNGVVRDFLKYIHN